MDEVMHDVPNFDHENHCIVVDHPKLNDKDQQEFGIGDHDDKLKMTEDDFDPIDIVVDVVIDIEVEDGDIKEKLMWKQR
ncbi:hypothetical protein PVK06_008834 [Gossypium arboreum]|uniref:Uncharacterized protein n=1 Tax=Gossypium arboreum TaxID=29729 RepID=A0ABR0QLW3_GOSAR|nr:hypothetical protein PVK06_008834 [Gossypium arboreum]